MFKRTLIAAALFRSCARRFAGWGPWLWLWLRLQ